MAMRKRTVLAIAAFLAADAALVAWWFSHHDATVSETPRDVAAASPPARPATSRVKPDAAPVAEPEHAPTLSVLVVDEADKPLAGAEVELRHDGKVVATRTSDTDGAASFGVAPPWPYEAEARIAGRGRHVRIVAEYEDYGRGDLTLTMRLWPGVPAHGRVVDDTTGRPIAGARVEVDQFEPHFGMIPTWNPEWDHLWAVVTTDADGVFRVPAIPSGPDAKREMTQLAVRVAAPGYADGVLRLLVDEIRPGQPLDVELAPTATAHGVVLLPDGSPAVGARVHVMYMGNVSEWTPDPLTADAAGRFSVDGVKVGARWEIEVTSADGVASGVFERVLVPASPAPDVELRLGAAASIVVHALGSGGRPLAHDDFYATVFDGGSELQRTDGLTPGRVRLHVCVGDDREWCGGVDAHAGANDVSVDFGAWEDVRGTARDDTGAAIPFASIEVRVPDRSEDRTRGPRCVTADAEGRFRVPCFAKSMCRLRVRGAAYVPEDHEFVAPAQDVALTACRSGGVTARLRLPPGGAPPGRPGAYADDEMDMLVRGASTAVVRDGVLEVTGLRPGRHDLHVWFDGYESRSLPVDVAAGTVTELPELELVPESFGEWIEFKFHAVDAAGAPVASASIATEQGDLRECQRTDAAGDLPSGLDRGEHIVRARAPGLAAMETFTVTGTTREVAVTLRSSRRVRIRAADRSDAATRIYKVELRTRDGRVWEEPQFDSRLRSSVEMPPGAWRLRAIGLDDKTLAETDFDVPASGDAPIDVAVTVR